MDIKIESERALFDAGIYIEEVYYKRAAMRTAIVFSFSINLAKCSKIFIKIWFNQGWHQFVIF